MRLHTDFAKPDSLLGRGPGFAYTAPMTDARAIALEIVDSVLRHRRPLDEALAAHEALAGLEPRDRAFARLLVATVLRRLGQIDAAIDARLERALPEKTPVRDILRLGVAQLGFLEVSPHAAVNTSVELARARKLDGFKGLVNAILRRIAEAGPLPPGDPGHRNVPDWLWQSWRMAWGDDVAAAIAEANLREAPLDISLRNPGEADDWAARLDAEILPTGTLRRPSGGDITALPGFTQGAWWVQDAGAALPARLLGNVAGLRVADLCAAPGGKTAQLVSAGAQTISVDISSKRLKRLEENLARLGLSAETVAADVTKWRPEAPFDAVLLDAPCSATGTLRRHPDIAWTKGPEDIARLAALQDRLLAAAVDMVKPGGPIVYATCSLQTQECETRIATLLESGAPVERAPIAPDEIPDLREAVTEWGDLRTLPCHWAERGGIDGFYVARLRRTG